MGQVNLNNGLSTIWRTHLGKIDRMLQFNHRPQGGNKGPLTIDWFGTVLED
jgi:hypothetical protein